MQPAYEIPADPNESLFQAGIRMMFDEDRYNVWTRAAAARQVLDHLQKGYSLPEVWRGSPEELWELAEGIERATSRQGEERAALDAMCKEAAEMRCAAGLPYSVDDISIEPNKTLIEMAIRVMLDDYSFDVWARAAAASTVIICLDEGQAPPSTWPGTAEDLRHDAQQIESEPEAERDL